MTTTRIFSFFSVLVLASCAGIPPNAPKIGFTSQVLADGSYKVIYTGAVGTTSTQAHQALHENAKILCGDAYTLEIVSDLLPNFDTVQTIGTGAQGTVRCLR